MSRKTRNLICLIVILLIFVGIYFGINKYNKNQEAESMAAEEADTILINETEISDISNFSYTYKGDTLSFTRNDEVWTYDGDTSIDIDEDKLTKMLESLATVAADRLVASDVKDFKDFGTDSPYLRINVELNDGTKVVYNVGSYNSTTESYYIRKDEDTDIYLINSSFTTVFEKSIAELTYTEKDTAAEETLND